jgi:hypothetical protein
MSRLWTLALPLVALVACGDKYDEGKEPDAVEGGGGSAGDDGGGSGGSGGDDGGGGEDNHAPTAPTVTLTPDPAETTDDLVAMASGSTDVDGDTVTYTYTWAVDGADSAASTSDTLPAAATTRGETWTVTVLPTDGDLIGAVGTASVTIDNAPPTLGTPAIGSSSAGVFIGDTLTCSATLTDDDDDATSVSYSWTNTTTSAALGTLATLLLEHPAVAPGDEVSCEITAEDEIGAQAAASTAVTVDNRAPTVDTVAISPESAVTTATPLTCTATASDADGETPTLDLAWSSSGGGVSAAGDTLVLTPSDVQPGETITCTATATDAAGETGADTASVTIDNTAPVIDSVTISPSTGALRGDTLTCAVTASDADGETLTEAFEWTDASGTVLGSSAALVVPTTITPGDVLTCTATVSDAHGGSETGTATATVDNNAPSVSGVGITPNPATVTDTLTCAWTFSDTEADADASTVSWTLGGVEVGTGTTLSSGFSSGDTMTCTVTPDDGYDTGTAASASLTISNSAPSVSGVTLDPDPVTAADTLTCTWTFSDADADADASTVAWTVDGSGAGSGTTLSGAFVGGQTVACAVTPDDGTDTGTVASASLLVTNTAPTAPEISVSPDYPDPGTDDLVCNIDTASTDIDGDTLTIDYAWTADGVAMSAYDGLDTVPASAVSVDETWTCTVTVTDATDTVSASASVTACATTTYYADGDGDGHGDSSGGTATLCEGEDTTGYATADDDCDDTDGGISPSAYEACDGVDNDCDGTLDPVDADDDGDGWTTCDGDCDDADAAVNPGTVEICGNGVDDDCDTEADTVDLDGDGYSGCETRGTREDCDDFSAAVNPAATEVLGDGLDNDCDGEVDDPAADDDGDGITEDGGDCDDAAPWISPTATEIPDSGIDEDCDGTDDSASTWSSSDAIFVDVGSGSDFFPGSPDFPTATLAQGISLASAAGLPVVVTEETYVEDVDSDVTIYGGYAADFSSVTGLTTIEGVLTATGSAATTFTRLHVTGAVESSATSLLLHECTIEADGTEAWAVTSLSGDLTIAESLVTGPDNYRTSESYGVRFGGAGEIWSSTIAGGASEDGAHGADGTRDDVGRRRTSCGSTPSGSGYMSGCGEAGEHGEATGSVTTVEGVSSTLIHGSLILGGTAGMAGDGGHGHDGSRVPMSCGACSAYADGCGGPAGDGGDGGDIVLVDVTVGTGTIAGSHLTGGQPGSGGDGGNGGDYAYGGWTDSGLGGDGGDAGQGGMWVGVTGTASVSDTHVSWSGLPTTAGSPGTKGDSAPTCGYRIISHTESSSPAVDGVSATGTTSFVALDLTTTSTDAVTDNVIDVGTTGTGADYTALAVEDGLVARNQVTVAADGDAIGIVASGTVDLLSNLVVVSDGATSAGIEVTGEDALLVNNTVVLETAGDGIWITSSHMVGLINNLVQTGSGGTCFVDDTSTRDYMLNNLAWGCTNQLYEDGSGFRTRAAEMDFITVTTAAGGHVHDDPLFTAASSEDYTLDTGSPAIDAGYDASSSTFGAITTDVFGGSAPAGGGYDIGAAEQ